MTEIQLVGKHACIQEGPIGALQEHAKNTDVWQEKQNGSLAKLAEKIEALNTKSDRTYWAIIALLLGVVADLVMRLTGVN